MGAGGNRDIFHGGNFPAAGQSGQPGQWGQQIRDRVDQFRTNHPNFPQPTPMPAPTPHPFPGGGNTGGVFPGGGDRTGGPFPRQPGNWNRNPRGM